MQTISDIDVLEKLLVEEEDTVVVEFWASWCKPCEILDLHLDRLSKIRAVGLKFVRVDVGSDMSSISPFRVHFLPTLMLFKEGKLLDTKVGSASQSIVESWLSENVPGRRASDREG